jgi:methyl-accepting chemotaxis protein
VKISTKLIALSLSAAAVVAALSATIVVEEKSLANHYRELIGGSVQQSLLVRKVQVDFKEQVHTWQNLLLHGTNPVDAEKFGKQFRAQQETTQMEVEALADVITDPAFKEPIQDFVDSYTSLNKRYDQAYELLQKTQDAKKAELMVFGADLAPTASIDDVVTQLIGKTRERENTLSVQTRHRLTVLVVCAVVLIGVFVCASTMVILNVVRRLARLKEVSTRISHADLDGLTQELDKGGLVGSHDEVGELAASMQELGAYFSEIVEGLNKLSDGDLSMRVQPRSESDPLARSYQRTVDSIAALAEDAQMLVGAGVAGNLTVRADLDRHLGEYRKVVLGYNQMLDAVIGPLNMAADYVARIGRGDIPPKITQQYQGDFKTLANNLNACLKGLEGLVEANQVLQLLSCNDLTQTVTGEYQGVFAEVGNAVNNVYGQLKNISEVFNRIAQGDFRAKRAELEQVGKRSENDNLIPAIVRTMKSIEALVDDAETLAKAAAEGRMNVRAEAARHSGDYRMVVEGMNSVLAAVSEPLHASADNAQWLASSSEELTAVSMQMAEAASETASQASMVSAASEQVSKNVNSVATASEQMQASIREIAKSANESARVAGSAVSMAESTNVTMKKLGDSSLEIGEVIKVIASIAEQTNLLALNATIEAARAGEAGKGFAVVANEVKELAKQTAKATEEIGQRIQSMQDVSSGAVHAIEQIGAVIHEINGLSNTIASAVEEQTATTNEIGRSVTEAATGVNEIAKNINGVAGAANHATQGAEGAKSASMELSKMAAQLQTIVAKYTF